MFVFLQSKNVRRQIIQLMKCVISQSEHMITSWDLLHVHNVPLTCTRHWRETLQKYIFIRIHSTGLGGHETLFLKQKENAYANIFIGNECVCQR